MKLEIAKYFLHDKNTDLKIKINTSNHPGKIIKKNKIKKKNSLELIYSSPNYYGIIILYFLFL